MTDDATRRALANVRLAVIAARGDLKVAQQRLHDNRTAVAVPFGNVIGPELDTAQQAVQRVLNVLDGITIAAGAR